MTTPKKPRSFEIHSPQNDLLKDLYQRDGLADATDWYEDNASRYDSLLTDAIGYVAPVGAALRLAEFVTEKAELIADIGCGTGLVGQQLALRGFSNINGYDYSQKMLNEAQSKQVYAGLYQTDLNQPLDLPDHSWGHAISVGAFSGKYIGAQALDEVFRLVKPGGIFINCVNEIAVDEFGFRQLYRDKAKAGIVEILDESIDPYHTHEDIKGHTIVFRILN